MLVFYPFWRVLASHVLRSCPTRKVNHPFHIWWQSCGSSRVFLIPVIPKRSKINRFDLSWMDRSKITQTFKGYFRIMILFLFRLTNCTVCGPKVFTALKCVRIWLKFAVQITPVQTSTESVILAIQILVFHQFYDVFWHHTCCVQVHLE